VFAERIEGRGSFVAGTVMDGAQSVVVLDGARSVAAGFVAGGTQYRPASAAAANDAAARTATAPIVAALAMC